MNAKSNLTKLIEGRVSKRFYDSFTPSPTFLFKEGIENDTLYVLADNGDRIFKESERGIRDMSEVALLKMKIQCYKNMINTIMDIVYEFDGEIIPNKNV